MSMPGPILLIIYDSKFILSSAFFFICGVSLCYQAYFASYIHSSQQAKGDSWSIHQLEVCSYESKYAFLCLVEWWLYVTTLRIYFLLYRDHQQALAERSSLSQYLPKSQEELPMRTMKDSEIEVHLPLGTKPELREKYLNFHNSVRCLTTTIIQMQCGYVLIACYKMFAFKTL